MGFTTDPIEGCADPCERKFPLDNRHGSDSRTAATRSVREQRPTRRQQSVFTRTRVRSCKAETNRIRRKPASAENGSEAMDPDDQMDTTGLHSYSLPDLGYRHRFRDNDSH